MYMLGTLAVSSVTACYGTLNFAWVCMVANATDEDFADEQVSWGATAKENAFAGYGMGQVLAFLVPGLLIDRFGPKWVVFGGLLTSATATCLISVVWRWGWGYVMAMRVLVGVGSSIQWPLYMGIANRWCPEKELGLAIGVISSGAAVGFTGEFFASGLECAHLGWPSVFQASTGFTALFLLLWILVFRNDPSSCGWISEGEKAHIVKQRPQRKASAKPATPWAAILASKPVWASVVASAGSGAVFAIVNVFAPTFMHEVVKVSLEKNGFLTALPILCWGVGRLVCGFALVGSLSPRFVTENTEVKILSAVSLVISGLATIALGYLGEESAALASALMALSQFSNALNVGGFTKAMGLIAGPYAATVTSMCFLANSGVVLALPYVVSALTPEGTTAEWQRLFLLIAAFATATALFFVVFG